MNLSGRHFRRGTALLALIAATIAASATSLHAQEGQSVGRGWPVPAMAPPNPGANPLPQPPEGITPLERDIFSSDDFYLDEALWTDPRYFRCNSSNTLDTLGNAGADNVGEDGLNEPWGDCSADYPVEGIVSPYPFSTAQEHFEALKAEAVARGSKLVKDWDELPHEWNGRFARPAVFSYRKNRGVLFTQDTEPDLIPELHYEPVQWTHMSNVQAATIAALLTPEYRKRYVQQLWHQANHGNAQWPASYCWPEGLLRQWASQPLKEIEFSLTKDRLQYIGNFTDNTIRNFYIGSEFKMDGDVPRLGDDIRRWYGESIAFWDGDALITWTSNVQGWMSHASIEHSNQLQTIEIWTPRVIDGEFIGLEEETIFYDPEAHEKPFRTSRVHIKLGEVTVGRPYTYVVCNQVLFPINGEPTPMTPGAVIEYEIPDLFGRPWAKILEDNFEQGMQRPEDESMFVF